VDEVVQKVYPNFYVRTEDDVRKVNSGVDETLKMRFGRVSEMLEIMTLHELHQEQYFLEFKERMIEGLIEYVNPNNDRYRALYSKEIETLNDFVSYLEEVVEEHPKLFREVDTPHFRLFSFQNNKDMVIIDDKCKSISYIFEDTATHIYPNDMPPSEFIQAIAELKVKNNNMLHRARHPDYYLMRDVILEEIDKADQVPLTAFEYEGNSPHDSSWIGCYTISKSDYVAYNIEELGVEGDHIPDRLHEQWFDVELADVKRKKELSRKQGKQEIKPKKEKSLSMGR